MTYADDGFLFATKLVAQRAKDVNDLLALGERLGLLDATPDQLEAHIRRYYTDEASLEFIVGPSDTDREIAQLAADAARVLNQAAPSGETAPGNRGRQGQARQRRNVPPSSGTPPSAPRRRTTIADRPRRTTPDADRIAPLTRGDQALRTALRATRTGLVAEHPRTGPTSEVCLRSSEWS